MTYTRTHPQRISEWLMEINPLAVMNEGMTANDFYQKTGRIATWPTHTIAETRHNTTNCRQRRQPDYIQTAWAWEIARTLCIEHAGVDPLLVLSEPIEKIGARARVMDLTVFLLDRLGL